MKFYWASRTDHYQQGLAFRAWGAARGHEVTSRWLDLVAAGQLETPEAMRKIWPIDLEDISKAEALVIYGIPELPLRGALIEAGAALAHGKPVHAVGANPGFGTWVHHPLVHRWHHLEGFCRGLRLGEVPQDA